MRITNDAASGPLKVFVYHNTDHMQSVALAALVVQERDSVEWVPPERASFAIKIFREAELSAPIGAAGYIPSDGELTIMPDARGGLEVVQGDV